VKLLQGIAIEYAETTIATERKRSLWYLRALKFNVILFIKRTIIIGNIWNGTFSQTKGRTGCNARQKKAKWYNQISFANSPEMHYL